ncbi:ABC transporter [Sphingobium sp. MK2]|uniref:Gldg family protein n=1 Tax=Sphingobium sp. MK2 TaxID=3116540 RepID=UPI0032E361D3
MMAALKRVLILWLPGLAILLAGLQRAFVTGQTDPWDWAWPALAVMAPMGLWLARRGWPLLAWTMGGVASALLFCGIAAGRWPDPVAAIGLVVVALSAVVGGALVRPVSPLNAKRMAGGVALLALAALLAWRGPAQPIQPATARPALAVITALPLFWDQQGRADAAIVTVLRTRFTVQPIDDARQLDSSPARLLLLAQPRAMPPEALVAVDRWVRSGGRAVVLADPLLRWPSDLPMGDRRRAPATSLLEPLLDHWGFAFDRIEDGERRWFLPDGTLLTLSGVQMSSGSNMVQRKRIGRGEVVLLGDADLIDDRLWLADPARPLDPRLWSADTPARVTHWLGATTPGDRRWMREGSDVVAALRWAILAGIGWAILGALLLRRAGPGRSMRTKKVYPEGEAPKSG